MNERIAVGDVLKDPEQAVLIDALSRLSDELPVYEQKIAGWRGKFIRPGKSVEVPCGIYAWGSVGRGKTFLMNAFYDAAPTQFKWRIHFHRFMLWVHEQNNKLVNEQNPLNQIAKQVAARARLLCLDEFMVTDIADAMILYQLLRHLYHQGVVIVTTSNIEPDGLYHNGIQRDLFLPAIELIKQHGEVVEIGGDSDFRRQAWAQEKGYFSPLGEKADAALAHWHTQLTGYPELRPASLVVAGRQIEAISVADGLAWFDFKDLCQTYRSQKDYIELSSQFNTLIVSGVPELGSDDDAAARRFINLVDTVYDYGVKLLVSAATPPDGIYTGSHLALPFKRTASRLWEMSTPGYLMRPENTA